jgi:ATP-dependent Zn protease
MSDATRHSIDEEQQFITDQAHRRALALVGEHRALLDALAGELLENEALERADIDRLVAAHEGDRGPHAERLQPLDGVRLD